jgi:hypothetical protein
MRVVKILLLILVVLLVVGMALPEDAFARGGRGGGRGGRGGRGGGRGRFKGKDGKDIVDRAALIETAEGEMHGEDRENRFQNGRKSDFETILKARREEVLARHRRMGEDTRRQEDSRLEVAR